MTNKAFNRFLGILPEIDLSITIHEPTKPYTIIKSKINGNITSINSS